MRTREQKTQLIDELTQKLSEYEVVYIVDILGLDAQTTSDLRRACYGSEVKLQVVKNTLLKQAMEKSDKDFGELTEVLVGNSALMLSKVGNQPAKIIKNFRKKSEKPVLKGAWIEESVYIGDDQVNTLVAIKSKEELLGELIGLLQSPAKNVISALKSGGGKLAGIIKTLSEKSE
jgi:large subunit ribosomal protein L10